MTISFIESLRFLSPDFPTGLLTNLSITFRMSTTFDIFDGLETVESLAGLPIA